MPTATILNPNSAPDAAACFDFAESVAERLHAGDSLRLSVGDAECRVTGDMALAIVDLLRMGSQPFAVELQALPSMLSTGQAADLLEVTRPTVVKLVDEGKLPATRVGTHRRIPTPDLLAYRERCRMERSERIDEIIRTSQDLGLYD